MFHHLALAAIAATSLGISPTSIAGDTAPPPGVQANYHGRTIDLSRGWGPAQACVIDGTTAECFDTEAELDSFLAANQPDPDGVAETALASCSTSTRLYAGTSFGLPVLAISQRQTWYNLAPAGFDNKTRSYKIGSCAAALAKDANGGGGFYPGNTAAGAQSTTMTSGWDRAVSSVYLY